MQRTRPVNIFQPSENFKTSSNTAVNILSTNNAAQLFIIIIGNNRKLQIRIAAYIKRTV